MRIGLWVRIVALIAASGSTRVDAAARAAAFNRDVRPILSANCFACHGPDENKRKAKLRLDREAGIRAAFGGALKDSDGWQRIIATDDDRRMPPPDAHRELTPAQIDTVRRWVEQGAKWEGHWSFLAPTRPAIPTVKNSAWIHNEIDAFILARLEQERLAPSPPADRERLLRRVCFDLVGLPPSVAEIDAFLADERPDAYEAVVDRLLASPHFGERMSVAWMDAARYGDTSVFHADGPRDMWPWRDWVIRAYNDNKPFDRFTVEQLAGDLLENPTREQQIATGFNRNNATTDEGGAIAEEYRVEYVVDRVRTTSMVWMGLSLECAQCHDHKFDPFTMTDYYRLFAYFNQAADPGMQTRNGNQTPAVDVYSDGQARYAAMLRGELPRLEAERTARSGDAAAAFDKWLATAQSPAGEASLPLVPLDPVVHLALDEEKGNRVKDAAAPKRRGKVAGKPVWAKGKIGGAFDCGGKAHIDLGLVADFERTDPFSFGSWVHPRGDAGGAPLGRMDEAENNRGFALDSSGGKLQVMISSTWPTNAIMLETEAKLRPDRWQHVFVTYDGSSTAAGVAVYVDGEPQKCKVVADCLTQSIRSRAPLYIGRRYKGEKGSPFHGLLDDVRIYGRTLAAADVKALAGHDAITPLLVLPPAQRTAEQVATLRAFYLSRLDEPYRAIETALRKRRETIATMTRRVSTVMVMQNQAEMRPTFVLARGNYASPQKDRPVQPGTPAILPPVREGAPANRLGLAEWLVQPQHPLTARVAVNRLWHMFFGTGIVKTLEDFGSQGEWPSHPTLLDRLAVDFVESGWDTKRLIRRMVTSSTYRQSSRTTPALQERDPENRLLARGPRFRLSGEFIRDNALAVSGLLVPTIGGPSVKPYQPDGLWVAVTLSGSRFVRDNGEKLYRRSLYTYWKRSAPPPSMTLFDAPSRERCIMRRSRTNTPLQAFVTLNDPQFVEAARRLAARAIREGGAADEDRVRYAYRLATGVRPSDEALRWLHDALTEERTVFAKDIERAEKLLAIGDAPRDTSIDPAEQAAMTVVASIILNLDETVTRP